MTTISTMTGYAVLCVLGGAVLGVLALFCLALIAAPMWARSRDAQDACGPEVRPKCPDCGRDIDPDYCHCGVRMDRHTEGDGHSPVPMGCVCGFAKDAHDACGQEVKR